jgi:hypothetical protein
MGWVAQWSLQRYTRLRPPGCWLAGLPPQLRFRMTCCLLGAGRCHTARRLQLAGISALTWSPTTRLPSRWASPIPLANFTPDAASLEACPATLRLYLGHYLKCICTIIALPIPAATAAASASAAGRGGVLHHQEGAGDLLLAWAGEAGQPVLLAGRDARQQRQRQQRRPL